MQREHATGAGCPPGAARGERIDFALERQRHARFVCREDVLAQLDQWLLGSGPAGWVVVTGGPGMGKSAVLSEWLARREAAGAAVPHHFVRRQVATWDQPEVIAASLAAQIEALFPALRDPDARPEGRLIELLGRVSQHLGAADRLVVLVDGLDETRAEPGENPLPRFLPHVVPPGIRLLCAMRPTYPHLKWIEMRSPARRIDLDQHRWAASNDAVVRAFWQAAAAEYEPPLSAETMATAIARAEGNVLHAVMLHDALQGLPIEERRIDRIPQGLGGLIGEIWDRAAVHAGVRAGLGLLCAAQEALSLDVIAELAAWGPDDYVERERFLHEARQLLLEEPAAWADAVAYRPRHDWVRELMAERLGAAMLRAHHAVLARRLASWPPPAAAPARRYALRHALLHRVETGAWEDTWRLAADMSFLEAKCRELGAHETEADVARVAERCRTSGDELFGARLEDLARALARESHWLRSAPDAIAALVWNRLRQLGWSAVEIDEQLQLPAGAAFLRIRQAATRESPALVRDLVGHTARVNACAVTPDGRRAVSASDDHALKVWDLGSGRELGSLEGHAASVLACAVAPDGRRAVSASEDQTLKVWDLESGRELATLRGHTASVLACAVTPDGRCAVSASDDQTLKVWDLESGRERATLAGHAAWVLACAVTPDGQRVVSASSDKTLKVWELASGRELATLRGHAAWVTACAVTPDGRRVVSASSDQTLKVWDLESGRELATLRGHAASVLACAVTPDERCVVSASSDQTLKVWDLESGRVLATWQSHAARVRACAVTPDGRRVVSASSDQTLKVWDVERGCELAPVQGHAARVVACAVTLGGRVMSASEDQALKVWDLESGRELVTLQGHPAWALPCAVTLDAQLVVAAPDDRTLRVWSPESGRRLATLRRNAASMLACAITPNGRRAISAGSDQTLRVWDLESGRVMVTLQGHAARVTACAVTPDGQRVVSAAADQTITVWDLSSGQAVVSTQGHTARVTALAVTPDGRRAVSASEDHTLKVWDLGRGRVIATLRGHTARVHTCAVMPDGRRGVSVSADQTLRVWDLESGACVLTHRAGTSFTAVAATANRIAVGDATGGVWILDVPAVDRLDRSYRRGRGSSPPPLAAGPPQKQTILFLAANPLGTDRLALDEECAAIERELRLTAGRDHFEFRSKWAVSVDELMRHLNEVQPAVVHFSGHGAEAGGGRLGRGAPHRDIDAARGAGGIFLHGDHGAVCVSEQALAKLIASTTPATRLVVLNACFSAAAAESLRRAVDCVVGMDGAVRDDAARTFAVAFYRALGNRRSVGNAVAQAGAALAARQLPDELAVCRTRDGRSPDEIYLPAAELEPA